jgi:hypothetical protein
MSDNSTIETIPWYPTQCKKCSFGSGAGEGAGKNTRKLSDAGGTSEAGGKTNYFLLDNRSSYELATTLPFLIAQEFLNVFIKSDDGLFHNLTQKLNPGSSNFQTKSSFQDWTKSVESLTSDSLKKIPFIGNELDELINGSLQTFTRYLQVSPLDFPIIPQIVEDEDDWSIPIPVILKRKATPEQVKNSMFKNDDFKALEGKLNNLTIAVAIPTVLIQEIQSLSKEQIGTRHDNMRHLSANFQKLNAISQMFNELDQNMQFFNQTYLQIDKERNSKPDSMTDKNFNNRLAKGKDIYMGQPIGRQQINTIELGGFDPPDRTVLFLLLSYITSIGSDQDLRGRRLSKQEQLSLGLGTFFQNEQDNPFSLSDEKGNFNKLFQLQKDTFGGDVGNDKGHDRTPTDWQSTLIVLGEGLKFIDSHTECIDNDGGPRIEEIEDDCGVDATINGKKVKVKMIGEDDGEKGQTQNIFFAGADIPVISFSWKKDVSVLSGDKPKITLNDTSALGKNAKVIAIEAEQNPHGGIWGVTGGGGNAAIIYVPPVRLKPYPSLLNNEESGGDDSAHGGSRRRLAPDYVENQLFTSRIFNNFNESIKDIVKNNRIETSAVASLNWYKSTLSLTLTKTYNQGFNDWCYAAAIGSVLGDRWAIRIAKGTNPNQNIVYQEYQEGGQRHPPLHPPIDPSLLAITCEIGTTKKNNFEQIVQLSYDSTDNDGFYVKNDAIGEICDCTKEGVCERAESSNVGPICPDDKIKEYYGINVVCDLFVAQRGLSKKENPCWGLVPLNAAFDFNSALNNFLNPDGIKRNLPAWFSYLFGNLERPSRPKPFIGKTVYKTEKNSNETNNDDQIWQDTCTSGWRGRRPAKRRKINRSSRHNGYGLSFGKIYSTEMMITDAKPDDPNNPGPGGMNSKKKYAWTNEEIMSEIETNGPIVGTMIILKEGFYRKRFQNIGANEDAWSWSLSNKNKNNTDENKVYLGGDHLEIKKDDIDGYHDISIVGWGKTPNNIDYWIIKNSFGEDDYRPLLRIRRTQSDINQDGTMLSPDTLDTVLCVRPRFLNVDATRSGVYKVSPGAYYFQAGWKESQVNKFLGKYADEVNPGTSQDLMQSNLGQSEPFWPLVLAIALCIIAILILKKVKMKK